ncbi:pantoate--beta-alanine ligase [Prevotella aff. ruminicola Tc2-24]|jgi:pantoate--beta-alanine ligase|uniref:Pantothenate synthetase n=1 Tax=Prevotella aff. ruminicola Tc2-24 TaxID=81582 RepID=A0A1I0NBJ6_9BACT|nr:pantoate--beta-alanine ligase [Prevotella aff. ruminicola Tc2-24]MBR4192478.1 pantoate--beta-alanine ligase [Prevotella sp.]SEV98427.1 pantoate--beta-alanine ligase [Prevotella aff. ruminicola Tc2-24]
MKVVKTIKEVREIVGGWRQEGLSVGLVPTMGYLHEGHQSLIKKSASQNDRTVVSVFVNPIQFGPNEDLEAYPRDLNRDIKAVEEAGGDLIFNPEPSEMYPGHFTSFIDTTETTELLCGAVRPVHFRGVCTVVGKLFNIVTPDRAYFGQKDAQQLATIRRFVRDLNFPLEIIACPIVREDDGLAKSSRNTYLNAEERQAALILSKSLKKGKEAIESGEKDAKTIIAIIKNSLQSEPLARIDYVEVVDFENIQRVDKIEGETLVAIAVYIGKTRLIDNFIIGTNHS